MQISSANQLHTGSNTTDTVVRCTHIVDDIVFASCFTSHDHTPGPIFGVQLYQTGLFSPSSVITLTNWLGMCVEPCSGAQAATAGVHLHACCQHVTRSHALRPRPVRRPTLQILMCRRLSATRGCRGRLCPPSKQTCSTSLGCTS